MPYSNFPGGFADGVTIRGLPIITNNTGRVFWVYNGTALQGGQRGGSNGNKGTYDSPFSTIDYAIGQCSASRGDIIMVKAGHAETLATASAIAADVAGVSIIGLGAGADRPTLTFSATDSTMVISAASVTMQNIITKPSIDSVVSPIVVSGADCWLDYEHQDASAAIEAVRAILTEATANRLHVNLVYRGFTAGNAVVNAVRLVGCDDGDINVDFYGVASTSVVEFLTTACTNINVSGVFYNSGTTDGSKDVVDTVGTSTWYADVVDAAAGARFTGGSAAALASDDVTAITNALYGGPGIATWPASAAPANGVSLAEALRWLDDAVQGANGVVTFPTGAAAANGVSLAEVLRYIQDQVINGTGTALDTNTSLYGVLAGASGIPTFPTGIAAANNVSLAEVIRYIQDQIINGTGTVLPTNDSLFGILAGASGITTFPAAALPANGVSIAEVLREDYDQGDKAVTNTTGTLVNGTTIFTIAGGPIEILSLVARCVTTNDGTASTLQWSADPTDGVAATFSAASASLASVAAGGMVILQGTTLATAPLVNASGVGLGQQVTNGIVVGAGIITTTVGVGSTTGTWQHHLRYRPLARGVTVS